MTKPKKKVALSCGMRINAYEVVARAVEEGVAYGWNRAHKHADSPFEDAIKAAIEDAVLSELCNVVQFHEDG